jgi:hypothetical protein
MFRLYHTNQIDTATFGGGSWQPLLPLDNLYSPSPTRRARSVNATTAATQFRISMAQSLTVHGIQIIATNLSAASTYRITWYTDSAFTAQDGTTGFITVGSSIDWANTSNWLDWMDVGFWLGTGAEIVDPDDQGVDIRHNFPSPQSMRYIKIEFADPTNADGFVEVGYVFIGDVFVPTYNVAPDPTYNRVSLTTMQQAVGGGQYFNRRGSRKRLVVNWQLLLQDEVFGELDQIIRIHDIDRPVYVDLEPDNILASGFTTAFLARMAQLPESRLLEAYIENDTGATIGFEFQQVL